MTSAHGWFDLDKESLLDRLDISIAELQLENRKRVKLEIANLPTGGRIYFDVHEASIQDLLSK